MKKIIILISTILTAIYIIGYTNKDIVFNTDEEILQYLNESDFMNEIGKENLSIVDTIHIEDSKIAIFLSDTAQGYIVCEKNEKGNYVMTDNLKKGIESNGFGGTDFLVRYNLNKGLENSDLAYIVMSDGSKVSSVEMSVNEHTFNKKLEIGTTSVTLLNIKDVLSEDELKEMISFDCRYFDIDNKELALNN